MKIKDIRDFTENKIIQFRNKLSIDLKDVAQLNMRHSLTFEKKDVEYIFRADKVYKIELSSDDQSIIDYILEKGMSYLVELLSNDTIKIKSFSFREPDIELKFLVEEGFFEKQKRKGTDAQEKLLRALKDDYLIENSNYLDNKRKIKENMAVIGNSTQNPEEFIISGKKNYLKIERVKRKIQIKSEGEEEKAEAIEVYVVRELNSDEKIDKMKYKFYLMKGEIAFTNNTAEARQKFETEMKMKRVRESSSSYLNTWRKYEDAEEKAEIENFQAYSYAKVESYERKDNGIQFNLKNDSIPDKFYEAKSSTAFHFISKSPEILFKNFSKEAYESFYENMSISKSPKISLTLKSVMRDGSELFQANVENKNISKISEVLEKGEGYIVYSFDGLKTVKNRRSRSRELIANGHSAMPALNLIIEGEQGNKGKREKIPALSSYVEKKYFEKHPPTETQRKAIEIALNTPDIVVIQGPPGTGKTTVITAILSRLQELDKKVGNMFGKNLVTSFQHDAVENAISRVKILGLDSVKMDTKSGEESVIFSNLLINNINETLNAYYENYPELKENVKVKELVDLYSNYKDGIKDSPEKNQCLFILKKLYTFIKSYEHNKEILQKIGKLESKVLRENLDYKNIEKRYFSKLPTSKIMYEDNGRYFIEKSLEILKDISESDDVYSQIQKNLEKILENEEMLFKNFSIMKIIKNTLLSKVNPKDNLYVDNNTNLEIEELFEDISEFIDNLKRKSSSYEEELRVYYMRELESNPLRVLNTLYSYTNTIGATCQGTQKPHILKAKNNGNELKKGNKSEYQPLEEYEKYDNVLIDEAARSTPLDLLIPMSLAKDRIILVGDHKQLPQIVDDTLVETIMNNEIDVTTKSLIEKNINDSLFETLIEKLEKLAKIDGIQRVITLDKQYRMHPIMGDYISKTFYETEEENEKSERKISSGLEAEVFKHQLKGLENKACVWFDIPYSETNKEKKENGSRYRPAEARAIAQHIAENIDSDEAKDQTFGVITFYAKQREEILKELEPYGITKKNGKGYKIISDYTQYESGDKFIEKLRVGTVDAFQGMEFDMVYLSTVRSNRMKVENPKDIVQKYGFLTYYNRLCVAMSRQKKLIMVFGDSSMINIEGVEDIKPLREFYKICAENEQYGKYIK